MRPLFCLLSLVYCCIPVGVPDPDVSCAAMHRRYASSQQEWFVCGCHSDVTQAASVPLHGALAGSGGLLHVLSLACSRARSTSRAPPSINNLMVDSPQSTTVHHDPPPFNAIHSSPSHHRSCRACRRACTRTRPIASMAPVHLMHRRPCAAPSIIRQASLRLSRSSALTHAYAYTWRRKPPSPTDP